MGAYAAILYGCLIQAERVLAFSPQTLLDRSLPYCPPVGVNLQVKDLEPLIRSSSPQTAVDVMVGWDNLVDVFYALRISSLPSVRVLAVPGASHTFVGTLGRKGLVDRVVGELLDGRLPDLFRLKSNMTSNTKSRIINAVQAFHQRDYTLTISQLTLVAERCPSWAGPQFFLGRAYFNASEMEHAEDAFRNACHANPSWFEPFGHLGRTLVKLRRPDEAEPCLRYAGELKPDWAWNYVFLGECLLQQGKEQEGRSALERAVALDPHLGDAVRAVQ